MCSWCEKETDMVPQVCATTFPMVCKNCGTKVANLDWKKLFLWKIGKLKINALGDLTNRDYK